MKEITKLMNILTEKNVKIEVISKFNGCIIKFGDGSDVACHEFSYGGEEGLMESYGMPQDEGDVTGYMTCEDVVERLYINGIIH